MGYSLYAITIGFIRKCRRKKVSLKFSTSKKAQEIGLVFKSRARSKRFQGLRPQDRTSCAAQAFLFLERLKLKIASHQTLPHPAATASDLPRGGERAHKIFFNTIVVGPLISRKNRFLVINKAVATNSTRRCRPESESTERRIQTMSNWMRWADNPNAIGWQFGNVEQIE